MHYIECYAANTLIFHYFELKSTCSVRQNFKLNTRHSFNCGVTDLEFRLVVLCNLWGAVVLQFCSTLHLNQCEEDPANDSGSRNKKRKSEMVSFRELIKSYSSNLNPRSPEKIFKHMNIRVKL
ncbi:hypothetical protein BD770DRAFT_406485 [Pilaira anomala]|nr:hypothetical protein BD770DRAFT_406485 [Pilaira anomala]